MRVLGAIGDAIVLQRTAEGRRALVAVNAGRTAEAVVVDGASSGWRALPGLVTAGVALRDVDGETSRLSIDLPAQASAVYLEA